VKTCKLLVGGLCVGDTFHFTSLLNRLMDNEGVTQFIWMTGTFARQAVEFMGRCFPIEPIFLFDTDKPLNINNIVEFKEVRKKEFEAIEADLSIDDQNLGFNFSGVEYDSPELRFRNLEQFYDPSEPQCLIVHPQSRNNWKNVSALLKIDWPMFGLPVYTAGAPDEVLIPNTIDFRGKTFVELAPKVLAAAVVVSIHSAVACFTFYTPTNLVTCHPGEGDYLTFSHFKSNALDILTPPGEDIKKPNSVKIVEAIEYFLNNQGSQNVPSIGS